MGGKGPGTRDYTKENKRSCQQNKFTGGEGSTNQHGSMRRKVRKYLIGPTVLSVFVSGFESGRREFSRCYSFGKHRLSRAVLVCSTSSTFDRVRNQVHRNGSCRHL